MHFVKNVFILVPLVIKAYSTSSWTPCMYYTSARYQRREPLKLQM